ncbi:FtsX-like permease family protein [Streptomyces sp. NRRL F-5053]|uniref:FtsX-like permease family protein n=1 Tax=Streptomyces sp. NRRL F-5053 TaxID=1463854 RepID=UPI00068CB122|nr:FtsX-like permease family protein [Streptomyces sp. NRRL F-5053]
MKPTPGARTPADTTTTDATGTTGPGSTAGTTGPGSRSRTRRADRWLRPRLRADAGRTWLLAALVLVTVFTAAALPRLADTTADHALRATLDDIRPAQRALSATATAAPQDAAPDVLRDLVRPGTVHRAGKAFHDAVPAPLTPDRAPAAHGVHNATPAEATDPGLPRPSRDLPPRATLSTQSGLDRATRLVSGHRPRATVHGPQGHRRLQAALTEDTARRMKLGVGDTFHLPGPAGTTTVEITGILAPRGSSTHLRDSVYWNAEESTRRPALVTVPPEPGGGAPKHYWHFTAFLHPDASRALIELPDGAELFFHQPLDTGRLAGHQAADAADGLAALTSGAPAARLQQHAGVGALTLDPDLRETLAGFQKEHAAVQPLLLISGLGLATTALAVLLLAGVLTAERSRDEHVLLRARGASLAGLTALLTARAAAVALPAAAVATALALTLTDGTRTGPALTAAAAATAVAVLALPLRAALTHRRVQTTAARTDLTRTRPSRRRTVLELTGLAVLATAVLALRRDGSDDGNALAALAPVLLALACAILLLRCYPLPLRLAARLAARCRGPVAFLGLARAARAPSPATVAPTLVALLVALTVAGFGGSVLTGIHDGRDRAALAAVGADARFEAPDAEDLLPQLARRTAHAPGVTHTTTLRVHDDAELPGVTDHLTVALVDAPAYARLARRNHQGAFPADALTVPRGTPAGRPLPALASRGLARALHGGHAELALPGLELPVRAAVTRDNTPAVRDGAFLVLSREAVARARPDTRGTALLAPNTLLADGDPDPAALHRIHDKAGPHADTRVLLTLRSEERARYADTVLQHGAEQLCTAATLGAAGYAALAVLLTLLHAVPERRALLVRLSTLGLPRRHGQGLLLWESLPLYALTAAAGALTGLAAVPLLGPGIDLTALAGTPDTFPAHVTADPASLTLPPLALLALAAAGLLLQARLTTRAANRPTAELRTEHQETR